MASRQLLSWDSAPPPRVVDDERLLQMWLHGKSANTRDAYLRDALAFSDFVDVPFCDVILADLQAYDLTLDRFSPATRARKLAAVKSLLSFGHRIGYLSHNVGAPVKAPVVKDTLAARILPEDAVNEMITVEPSLRNRLILSFLYYGGLRVSEACALCWGDLTHQRSGLQVTIFGKGGRTRNVLLPRHLEAALDRLAPTRISDEPIFKNLRTGKALHRSQVYRIVRIAARRAGLSQNVSPHWLRHAHASHALDNGAPSHLVQQTLGHNSLATTGRYAHARPKDSSSRFIRGPSE